MYEAWASVVKPAHHRYIEPTKRLAHLVVPSQSVPASPTHLHRRNSEPDAADNVAGSANDSKPDDIELFTIQLIQAYFRQAAATYSLRQAGSVAAEGAAQVSRNEAALRVRKLNL